MPKLTTIAVTRFEYDKAPKAFDTAIDMGFKCIPAPSGEAELSETISRIGARHAIVGVEKYHGVLYDVLSRGGVIARYGVGFDAIDLVRATAKGILCTNTPGVLESSVAEHTIALILSAARRIHECHCAVKKGFWTPLQSTELKGKRLAIIGCGLIGCSVARIASAGFGMEVIGCEARYVDTGFLKHEHGFTDIVRDFAQAVTGASFVSLHIPSTPATRHFINERRLKLMPASSWLINTARGAVVDESALYDAIIGGTIRGAALDVFEHEPYMAADTQKDLRTLDNVIMTPHIASATFEACERVADRALRNIQLAEMKEYETMDLLNPDVLLTLA